MGEQPPLPPPDGGSREPDRNGPVPGLGISFLARRARSSWLLLACVAVTVLLTTGLAAVLWTFSTAVIPPGARSILAAPQGRVIALSGVMDDAGQAAADSQLIRATLRKAWPGTGYQMESALWATPVPLSPPRAVRAEASPVPGFPAPVAWQIQVGALAGIRAQAMLTAGRWPGPPHPGGPLPVALPVTVATRLHLAPGSVLKAATGAGLASAGLRVTGLFRPRNPASPYWALDLVPVSGFGANAVAGPAPGFPRHIRPCGGEPCGVPRRSRRGPGLVVRAPAGVGPSPPEHRRARREHQPRGGEADRGAPFRAAGDHAPAAAPGRHQPAPSCWPGRCSRSARSRCCWSRRRHWCWPRGCWPAFATRSPRCCGRAGPPGGS